MLSAVKHYRTAWCIAMGWALLAAWADLFGHSAGFAQSYSGLVGLGNMRIYWLLGLLLLAAAMAALPRAFERSKRILFFCMPLAASFGTMAFAVAAQQTFFQPEAVALLGIIVAGAGYTWFTCLFCGILAKTQSMSCAIGSIVASLALKTVLVQMFTGVLSEAMQVGLAIMLPFAIAALAEAGERGPRTRVEDDEWVPALGATNSYRYVVPQILVAALAVATTRVLTPLGFFGDPLNQFTGMMPSVVGTMSVVAVLVGLSYAVLVKRAKTHLNRRFMPAFLWCLSHFSYRPLHRRLRASCRLPLRCSSPRWRRSPMRCFGRWPSRRSALKAHRRSASSGWRQGFTTWCLSCGWQASSVWAW